MHSQSSATNGPPAHGRRATCDTVRVDLSARLDGEKMTLTAAAVQLHLSECAACRSWLATAERVNRLMRDQPAPGPDLSVRIMSAVQAEGSLPRPGAGGRAARRSARTFENLAPKVRLGARWALGLLAAAQLMVAVPDLLGAAGREAHTGREVAALSIALAVGLLGVASYPEYARVFAPVIVALVVCFGSASVLDLAHGVVTPSRVTVHLVSLAQAVLVWLLARPTLRDPVPV